MSIRILLGQDHSPHRNLAREEALLLRYDLENADDIVLYLWQNANTVVIGRNQNAWKECRTAVMEENGVVLARRTTGGGAVFHDLGNLNFSFLMPKDLYDLPRQMEVIGSAVRSFGIDCSFSGRNDLLADGRKFSGNAFRFTRRGALHHGTLMLHVDFEALSRYLQPSKEKLQAKGVQSVRSRVVNLSELGDINVSNLTDALCEAFCASYGSATVENADTALLAGYDKLAVRNATWDWNYGAALPFDAELFHRFSWGEVQLQLSLEGGYIRSLRVFTDAMDPDLGTRIHDSLLGCPFDPAAMALHTHDIQEELSSYLGSILGE